MQSAQKFKNTKGNLDSKSWRSRLQSRLENEILIKYRQCLLGIDQIDNETKLNLVINHPIHQSKNQ